MFTLNNYFETGSNPPPLPGRHFKILLKLNNVPLKKPNLYKASIVYMEHVGVNLQCGLKKGLKHFWYTLIKKISNLAILFNASN